MYGPWMIRQGDFWPSHWCKYHDHMHGSLDTLLFHQVHAKIMFLWLIYDFLLNLKIMTWILCLGNAFSCYTHMSNDLTKVNAMFMCHGGRKGGRGLTEPCLPHPTSLNTLEISDSNYGEKEFVPASYYFGSPQRTISNSILEVSFFLLFFIKSTQFFSFRILESPKHIGVYFLWWWWLASCIVIFLFINDSITSLLFFCFLSYLAFICIFLLLYREILEA